MDTSTTPTIAPAIAFTNSLLAVVTAGWTDGDVAPEGYLHQWTRNAADIVGANGPTLDGANFVKGDVVACRLTAFDGANTGNTIETGAVQIRNTRPWFASAQILPELAYSTSTLSIVTAGWADPDGDSESYRYQWL